MLRCTSSHAASVRAIALRSARSRSASSVGGGNPGLNPGGLPARRRRSFAASACHGLDTAVDARRRAQSCVYPPVVLCGIRTSLPCSHIRLSTSMHTLAAGSSSNLRAKAGAPQFHARRQLSTRRGGGGLPPGRSVPEKIFAGMVVLVLAAWGLFFGAIALVLLPFIGIGLFLLRRNFQRGGMSRNLAAGLARKMAERGGGVAGGSSGGFGPMMGGGGADGGGGVPWMQRAPTEGMLSSLLGRMLGGGIRGIELVGVLRSEVEKRALRHSGLSSALGGGIESFTDVEMSTVGSVGGSFSPGPGNRSGGGGNGPSRVIEAKLRFSGQRGRGGGWAEVKVSDWGQGQEEEDDDGMEFDRIFVTLDNGRKFDLTSDSFAGDDDDDKRLNKEGSSRLFRGQHKSSSSSSGRSSKGAGKAAGKGNGSRPRRASKTTTGKGTTIEAEFRDK